MVDSQKYFLQLPWHAIFHTNDGSFGPLKVTRDTGETCLAIFSDRDLAERYICGTQLENPQIVDIDNSHDFCHLLKDHPLLYMCLDPSPNRTSARFAEITEVIQEMIEAVNRALDESGDSQHSA